MLDEPDPEKEGVREALPLVDHMAEGDLQRTFDKPADHLTLGKIIEGGMLSQEKYYEKTNPSKKNSVTRNDSNWGYNVKTRQKTTTYKEFRIVDTEMEYTNDLQQIIMPRPPTIE